MPPKAPSQESSRYLQPHRPGGSWEASRSFVTFLPEKALLATWPWLTISSLQIITWGEIIPNAPPLLGFRVP